MEEAASDCKRLHTARIVHHFKEQNWAGNVSFFYKNLFDGLRSENIREM